MKKVQLEAWTTFDKLCLVTAMLKLKNTTNWGAISRHTKQIYDSVNTFIEYGVRNDDWFSHRQCSAQYEVIFKKFGGRKKKRGERQPDNLEFLQIMEQTFKREFTAELEGTLDQLRDDYLRSKKIVEDLDNDTMEPERFQQLLLEMEGGSAKSRLKTMLDGKNADNESSPQVVQAVPSTPGSDNATSSPLLTSLLQSPSPLRPSLPSTTSPTISLLLNSSPPIPISGIVKEMTTDIAHREEVIPPKLLDVKLEDEYKKLGEVLDGGGQTIEQVEDNAIETASNNSLEEIHVENVNDTVDLTQDGPVEVIVLDSSQDIGEGESAILDNQSVIINGEPVKFTNETVVIDSSDLSISDEAVLLDDSQLKLNRIHKDTVVIEEPPLNVYDVPTNVSNDTVIIDDTALSSETVILDDSAVKINDETLIVGDSGMKISNEVNLDESDNGAIVLEETPLEIGSDTLILDEKSNQLTILDSNDLKLNEETLLISNLHGDSKNAKLIINAGSSAEVEEVPYSPINDLDTSSLKVETGGEDKVDESIFRKSDLYYKQSDNKDKSDYENKMSHSPQDIDNIPVTVEIEGTSYEIKDTEDFIKVKDVLEDDNTTKNVCEAQTLHVDDQGNIYKNPNTLKEIRLQKPNQLNSEDEITCGLNLTNELENVSSQNNFDKCERETLDSEKDSEQLKLEDELDKDVFEEVIIIRDNERHKNTDLENEEVELNKMFQDNDATIEEISLESENGNNSMPDETYEEEEVQNEEDSFSTSERTDQEINYVNKDLEKNGDKNTCEDVVLDSSPHDHDVVLKENDRDTVLKEGKNEFRPTGQENKNLEIFMKKESSEYNKLGPFSKNETERKELTIEDNEEGKESEETGEMNCNVKIEIEAERIAEEEDYRTKDKVNVEDKLSVESNEMSMEDVRVDKEAKLGGLAAETEKEDKGGQVDEATKGTKEHLEEIVATEEVNMELNSINFEEEEVKNKQDVTMRDKFRVNEYVHSENELVTNRDEPSKTCSECEETEVLRTRDEVNIAVKEIVVKEGGKDETVKLMGLDSNSGEEVDINATGIQIDEVDVAKHISCGLEDAEESKMLTKAGLVKDDERDIEAHNSTTNVDNETRENIEAMLVPQRIEESSFQVEEKPQSSNFKDLKAQYDIKKNKEVNTNKGLKLKQNNIKTKGAKMKEERDINNGMPPVEEAEKKLEFVRGSERRSEVLEKDDLDSTEKPIIIMESNASERTSTIEEAEVINIVMGPSPRAKIKELITTEKQLTSREPHTTVATKTDIADENVNLTQVSNTRVKVLEKQEIMTIEKPLMEKELQTSEATTPIEAAEKVNLNKVPRTTKVPEKQEFITIEKSIMLKEPNTSHGTKIIEEAGLKVNTVKSQKTREKVQRKEELITIETPLITKKLNTSDGIKTVQEAEEVNFLKGSRTRSNQEKDEIITIEKPEIIVETNTTDVTETTMETERMVNMVKGSRTRENIQEREELRTIEKPMIIKKPDTSGGTKTNQEAEEIHLVKGSRTRAKVQEKEESMRIEKSKMIMEPTAHDRTKTIEESNEKRNIVKGSKNRTKDLRKEESIAKEKTITIKEPNFSNANVITEENVNIVKGTRTRSKAHEIVESITKEKAMTMKGPNTTDVTKTIEETEEKVIIGRGSRTRSKVQDKVELMRTEKTIIIKEPKPSDVTKTIEETEEKVNIVKGLRRRSKVQEKEPLGTIEKPIIIKQPIASDVTKTIEAEEKINIVKGARTRSKVQEKEELMTITKPIITMKPNTSDENRILEDVNIAMGSRTRSKAQEKEELMIIEKPMIIKEPRASDVTKTVEEAEEKVNIVKGLRRRSKVQEKEELMTPEKPIIITKPHASDSNKTIEEEEKVNTIMGSRTRSKVQLKEESIGKEKRIMTKEPNVSEGSKIIEEVEKKVNITKGPRRRSKVQEKEESITKDNPIMMKEPNASNVTKAEEELGEKVNTGRGLRRRSNVQEKEELMTIEKPMIIKEPNASDVTKTMEEAEKKVNVVKGLRTRAKIQEKDELIKKENPVVINESIIKGSADEKVRRKSRERLSAEIDINKDVTKEMNDSEIEEVGRGKKRDSLKEVSKVKLDGRKKVNTDDKLKEVKVVEEVKGNEQKKRGRKSKEEEVKAEDVRDNTMADLKENEKNIKEVKAEENLIQKRVSETESEKIKKLKTRELQNLNLDSIHAMRSSRNKNVSLKTVSPISKLDSRISPRKQLKDKDLTTIKVSKDMTLLLCDPGKDDLQGEVPPLIKESKKKQNKTHDLDKSGGLPDGDQSSILNKHGIAIQNAEIGSEKKLEKSGGRGQVRPPDTGPSRASGRSRIDSSEKSIEKSTETPQGNVTVKYENTKKRGRKPKLVNIYSKEPSSMDNEKFLKTWKKNVMLVHEQLASHKDAAIVTKPPRKALMPIYKETIYCPMDLPLLKKRLDSGEIKTTVEFQRDVILMIQNVLMFNADDSPDFLMALAMSKDYIEQMEIMVQALSDGVLLLENETEEEKFPRSRFSTASNEEHTRKRRATTAHLPDEPRHSKRARNSVS